MVKEAALNDYGKDKLKNIAQYENNKYYPIVHRWVDCNMNGNMKKFVIYFAIPDDFGNIFVIPGKWCNELREHPEYGKSIEENYKLIIKLNQAALDQLNKAGSFKKDAVYIVDDVWESKGTTGEGKVKFDVFFSILDDNGHLFIVQSGWGSVDVLGKEYQNLYKIDLK